MVMGTKPAFITEVGQGGQQLRIKKHRKPQVYVQDSNQSAYKPLSEMMNPFGEASNSLTASLIKRILTKIQANDHD